MDTYTLSNAEIDALGLVSLCNFESLSDEELCDLQFYADEY